MSRSAQSTRNPATRTPDCGRCGAHKRSEWCVLDRPELACLSRKTRRRHYLPGETLFAQGEACTGLFCIESGLVGTRRMDADGNSVLLQLTHAGETLGYGALFTDETHALSAEALKPSTICFIEGAAIRTLLDGNPRLCQRFMRHAARDLNEAQDRILRLATHTVRARFARFLLDLSDSGKTESGDTLSLELPVSRQDLAAMLGTRPETMSRAIRHLERAGIAHFQDRRVHVPAVHRLRDQAENELS